MSGRSRGSTRGCLTPSWVRIAKSVTSEPEPEVVGIAASGKVPWEKYTIALAQSSALPPPSAATSSGANSRSRAVPAAAVSTSGSGLTPSKISLTCAPDACKTRCAVPFFTKKGSATRKTRFAPNSFNASTAPEPDTIRVRQENDLMSSTAFSLLVFPGAGIPCIFPSVFFKNRGRKMRTFVIQ